MIPNVYHFLPSCMPILLSISTSFSPKPLPPSSALQQISLVSFSPKFEARCDQLKETLDQVVQGAANPPTG